MEHTGTAEGQGSGQPAAWPKRAVQLGQRLDTADSSWSGRWRPGTRARSLSLSKGRADVLTDLLLDPPGPTPTTSTASAASEGSDAEGGTDPESVRDPLRATPAHAVGVQVVVTLATLLGLADDPGEMPGVGPIPADLAADGNWRLLVTDTAGTVINVSAKTYRPTVSLARHVRAREPICRMPGCRRSSHRCDLDHTITYPRGPSTPDNLGPLCRRDHNQKTLPHPADAVREVPPGLWGLTNHDDGAGGTGPAPPAPFGC